MWISGTSMELEVDRTWKKSSKILEIQTKIAENWKFSKSTEFSSIKYFEERLSIPDVPNIILGHNDSGPLLAAHKTQTQSHHSKLGPKKFQIQIRKTENPKHQNLWD